jgi:hypothetical protein
MALNILCTWGYQDEIRALPVGFKKSFDNLSAEIQTVQLKKLLGIEFYNAILSNKAEFSDLINGCSFENGGVTYNHEGLVTFLAHLIAAEFQVRGKIYETAAGVVSKNNQDFEAVPLSVQKQLRNEMNEYAMTFWTEIERYLLCNSVSYPLFRSNVNAFYTPDIFVIK